jgi:hypothetical protein
METILKDLRYGLRAWLKAPGFTFVVVLTLACGIGANTTVFSVINTLFLNPLPVDRPAELVAVRTVDAGARSNDAIRSASASHRSRSPWRPRRRVIFQQGGRAGSIR